MKKNLTFAHSERPRIDHVWSPGHGGEPELQPGCDGPGDAADRHHDAARLGARLRLHRHVTIGKPTGLINIYSIRHNFDIISENRVKNIICLLLIVCTIPQPFVFPSLKHVSEPRISWASS